MKLRFFIQREIEREKVRSYNFYLFVFLSLFITTSLSANPSSSNQDASQSSFQVGINNFLAYFHKKEAIVPNYRRPSLPYVIHHGRKTKNVALLIHGLSDSPYYMKDIAASLYTEGFNVVTILLPGHGTSDDDIIGVTMEDWRREVLKGVEIAKTMGDSLWLGGFSTGGALSVDYALDHKDIGGLLLFAPALRYHKLAESVADLSCLSFFRHRAIKSGLALNPVKYSYRYGNGVCQLERLKDDMENRVAPPWRALNKAWVFEELGSRIDAPIFLVISSTDQRLSVPVVDDFFRGNQNPNSKMVLLEYPMSPRYQRIADNDSRMVRLSTPIELPHSYIVLDTNDYTPQKNPIFDQVDQQMVKFLQGVGATDGGLQGVVNNNEPGSTTVVSSSTYRRQSSGDSCVASLQ